MPDFVLHTGRDAAAKRGPHCCDETIRISLGGEGAGRYTHRSTRICSRSDMGQRCAVQPCTDCDSSARKRFGQCFTLDVTAAEG